MEYSKVMLANKSPLSTKDAFEKSLEMGALLIALLKSNATSL